MNFLDPGELTARLQQIGRQSQVDRDGRDWITGAAGPDHVAAPRVASG